MNSLTKLSKRWLIGAVIGGLVSLWLGFGLITWTSGQTAYYNAGLQAYQAGDMPAAIQLFDRSIAAYKAEKNASWTHRFIYPKPDTEMAAQAYFHKGKAHLQNKQAELAVESLKESLRLNPGDQYEGLDPADAKRLHEEALVVKYDLEQLFKSRPDQAQQQGKGKGKGKGDKPGNQQAPGTEPGSQPGKGNRDDI